MVCRAIDRKCPEKKEERRRRRRRRKKKKEEYAVIELSSKAKKEYEEISPMYKIKKGFKKDPLLKDKLFFKTIPYLILWLFLRGF